MILIKINKRTGSLNFSLITVKKTVFV